MSVLYARANEYVTKYLNDNYEGDLSDNDSFCEWLDEVFAEAVHDFEFNSNSEFVEAMNFCNQLNGDCNVFTSPVVSTKMVLLEYLKNIAGLLRIKLLE